MYMKLSILDQSPVSSGQTAREALQNSLLLAEEGDRLGYERIWFTEHHDLPGLASSVPEVLLAYVGSATKNIRIGAGAVLLPHYKPYRVAEAYNMLSVLFPNRVDVGIGRAPGGSAEATMALSDNYLQSVYKMPELVEEFLHFLKRDFPKDNPFAKLEASPVPQTPPMPWMLGTSAKSAKLAAKNGMAYAFGEFMSDNNGLESLNEYRKEFMGNGLLTNPQTLLTVSVICAETEEKARDIALSNALWRIRSDSGEGHSGIPSIEEAKRHQWTGEDFRKKEKMEEKMIIGDPLQVKEALLHLQKVYQVEELMLLTAAHQLEDRLNSYRLIAAELL